MHHGQLLPFSWAAWTGTEQRSWVEWILMIAEKTGRSAETARLAAAWHEIMHFDIESDGCDGVAQ